MKTAKVKHLIVELSCPHCGELQIINIRSPNYIHQGSHQRMCEKCWKDYYWSFQAQISLDGMPEFIKPLRSY